MIKSTTNTLLTFVLAILPFLIGSSISKYSPYIKSNSFDNYVLIWAIITVVIASALVVAIKYFYQPLEPLVRAGAILFLLVGPATGIIGLAAPPDLGIQMLQHPEREHFRYTLLFGAALLFGVYFIYVLRNNYLETTGIPKWLLITCFSISYAEFMWEFSHHYAYPEALKEWVDQGMNMQDFGPNYDDSNAIALGAIGRFFQFTLIAWLSVRLHQLQKTTLWSPIISIVFGLLGVVSATVMVSQATMPKSIEFLFLFFIPGIPFLLLYWIGVASLTKGKHQPKS